MFGNLKTEGLLGHNKIKTKYKKDPDGDPDNGGLIVKDNLKLIGVENTEEMSRDREKWKDVVVAAMNNGP